MWRETLWRSSTSTSIRTSRRVLEYPLHPSGFHPSISTAYVSAISEPFAPTSQLQRPTLATTFTASHYSSYQLDRYQLEEAIETLERGRAFLWSEVRNLQVRSSVARLLEVDSA